MPSHHINNKTFSIIEKKTVKATIKKQKPIKTKSMLDLVIKIGIENIKEEDYNRLQ